MSSIVQQKNIAALITPITAIDNTTITAPKTPTAAYTAGTTIDRLAQLPPNYLSAAMIVPYKATLAAKRTAILNAKVEDSADGTTWALYGTAASPVALGSTGATAAQTLRGIINLSSDLNNARRYIRVDVQASFLATSADNIALSGVAALGGADRLN